MNEPFLPVCEPTLLGNEHAYVSEAVSTGWISSSGRFVGAFEEAFATYCGAKEGIAVTNGTVALHLALAALGIGAGDEVIIPNFTMIASAFAVCYTGAVPVFVDAQAQSWNIDPNLIEAKITEKTKAIMVVHIMGLPCDMEAIGRIADKYGLALIEDAAEAHGAEFQGRRTGSLGQIAAFSFFGNKNLSTGEGGMVVTSDPELARRSRYLKNLCFPLGAGREYLHEDIGFNYRMSNLHAAIGLAQVERADEYREKRIRNHMHYRRVLSGIPGIAHQLDPSIGGGSNATLHVHWMNAVLVDQESYGRNRDELMLHLKEHGIDSRKLFVGMHRQPSLAKFGCDCSGSYPVSDLLGERGLYLPSATHLSPEQIERVVAVIRGGGRH